MATDAGEYADRAISTAYHHELPVEEVEAEVVVGAGDLIGPTGAEPLPRKESLHFARVDGGRGEGRGRQGVSLVERSSRGRGRSGESALTSSTFPAGVIDGSSAAREPPEEYTSRPADKPAASATLRRSSSASCDADIDVSQPALCCDDVGIPGEKLAGEGDAGTGAP
jgi:hypothetical protein